MSGYTDSLTAQQLIEYIANDYYELSWEKVKWQRDEWRKNCRDWLEKNMPDPEPKDFPSPIDDKQFLYDPASSPKFEKDDF